MEEVQIKKAWKTVKFHAKIVWRGFGRTLYGASIAFLILMAISGFVSLGDKTGWAAVVRFIYSCSTLSVSIFGLYRIGTCKKRG